MIHALAASFVILFGPVNMIRRRRDSGHRTIGRIYVIAMYFVCVSGMFIYSDAEFTIFHALAILNFSCVTIGVIAIRKRNHSLHAGMMIGSWIGTTVAGGFAAFVPGRAIPTLAAEAPGLLWSIVAAVIIAATVVVVLTLRPARP
ncbi:DUF2306 domain-containing protein [Microbacterium testaceum]|uniref:DUF2306 domain-containing protein n=1 Tax=Microbacterium testaceum TaxID=2033 RepID=UPI00187C40ED|nr:DUF2306 domain-containing protein [Microbacterium testaceum]